MTKDGNKVKTWHDGSTFTYDGCVLTDTVIKYGKNVKNRPITITTQQYAALRKAFLGQVAKVGTSRTQPPAGSIGAWLQKNLTPIAIASYIVPILLREGYAVQENKESIRIIR